jgi:hypothetical protein
LRKAARLNALQLDHTDETEQIVNALEALAAIADPQSRLSVFKTKKEFLRTSFGNVNAARWFDELVENFTTANIRANIVAFEEQIRRTGQMSLSRRVFHFAAWYTNDNGPGAYDQHCGRVVKHITLRDFLLRIQTEDMGDVEDQCFELAMNIAAGLEKALFDDHCVIPPTMVKSLKTKKLVRVKSPLSFRGEKSRVREWDVTYGEGVREMFKYRFPAQFSPETDRKMPIHLDMFMQLINRTGRRVEAIRILQELAVQCINSQPTEVDQGLAPVLVVHACLLFDRETGKNLLDLGFLGVNEARVRQIMLSVITAALEEIQEEIQADPDDSEYISGSDDSNMVDADSVPDADGHSDNVSDSDDDVYGRDPEYDGSDSDSFIAHDDDEDDPVYNPQKVKAKRRATRENDGLVPLPKSLTIRRDDEGDGARVGVRLPNDGRDHDSPWENFFHIMTLRGIDFEREYASDPNAAAFVERHAHLFYGRTSDHRTECWERIVLLKAANSDAVVEGMKEFMEGYQNDRAIAHIKTYLAGIWAHVRLLDCEENAELKMTWTPDPCRVDPAFHVFRVFYLEFLNGYYSLKHHPCELFDCPLAVNISPDDFLDALDEALANNGTGAPERGSVFTTLISVLTAFVDRVYPENLAQYVRVPDAGDVINTNNSHIFQSPNRLLVEQFWHLLSDSARAWFGRAANFLQDGKFHSSFNGAWWVDMGIARVYPQWQKTQFIYHIITAAFKRMFDFEQEVTNEGQKADSGEKIDRFFHFFHFTWQRMVSVLEWIEAIPVKPTLFAIIKQHGFCSNNEESLDHLIDAIMASAIRVQEEDVDNIKHLFIQYLVSLDCPKKASDTRRHLRSLAHTHSREFNAIDNVLFALAFFLPYDADTLVPFGFKKAPAQEENIPVRDDSIRSAPNIRDIPIKQGGGGDIGDSDESDDSDYVDDDDDSDDSDDSGSDDDDGDDDDDDADQQESDDDMYANDYDPRQSKRGKYEKRPFKV